MNLVKARKLREERLNIRTTTERKEPIVRAAEREGKSVSDFILENALSAAEAIVIDHAYYSVDKRRWNAFCSILDAPPRKIPALRKLLTEQGVFDAK